MEEKKSGTEIKQPERVVLSVAPPQQSAQDTSNWEDKSLIAPNGRVLTETNNKDDKDRTVISE
jgi:hypothetical protein